MVVRWLGYDCCEVRCGDMRLYDEVDGVVSLLWSKGDVLGWCRDN